MTIVGQWLTDLESVLSSDPIVVSDVRIGVFYTAARLSTGQVGVAFTPRDVSDAVCCPRSAASAPPAGRIAGQDCWTLSRYALSPVPLRRAVGVAVLNALSALAMERHPRPGWRVVPGVDALAAVDIRPEDRVALVGAFGPFIKTVMRSATSMWVIDKHRDALKPDEVRFWRPPEQAAEVLSRATVAIITGSALVEGGLDDLLVAARSARAVVLAGPTASPWPPTFFERGLTVLAGIRVVNPIRMLQVVGEGGSGYFFEGEAEKVCVMRETTGLRAQNAAIPTG